MTALVLMADQRHDGPDTRRDYGILYSLSTPGLVHGSFTSADTARIVAQARVGVERRSIEFALVRRPAGTGDTAWTDFQDRPALAAWQHRWAGEPTAHAGDPDRTWDL